VEVEVRELMRSLWLKDDRGSDVVDDDRPKQERATGELRELRKPAKFGVMSPGQLQELGRQVLARELGAGRDD
jgi:hypothetical protein